MPLNFTPVVRGRWAPGKTANPGGRPANKSLQELCRTHTAEAVKTLVVAMHFKGPQQVPAAIAILDRGWGKPTQTIETTGDSALALHLLAAQAISASLLEAQQSAGQTVVDTSPEEQQRLLSADPPTE